VVDNIPQGAKFIIEIPAWSVRRQKPQNRR
jgi:hypothetical protein